MHASRRTTESARASERVSLARPKPPHQWAPAPADVQLQRALGNQAYGRFLQAKLTVGAPDDCYEREADRVADHVMRAEPVCKPLPATPLVQRQGVPSPDAQPGTQEDEYKEAAKKTAEAFLETETGKKIKERAVDLATTLPGLVIVGGAAAGIVAKAAIKNEELLLQPPAIPLDTIGLPGMKMQLTWEGPFRNPTKAMIGFSGTFGAGTKEEEEEEAKPSSAERQRAENARRAETLRQFREGLKTPEQRAAEEAAMTRFLVNQVQDPTSPLYIPGLKPADEVAPLVPKEEEQEGEVQREAAGPAPDTAPPVVYDVLRTPGRPLDATTRTFMEPRFGYDFSAVRVHADARAAASARSVRARAFTVGQDVVFGTGQYAPKTTEGKRLLAHELTHVMQQANDSDRRISRIPQEDEIPDRYSFTANCGWIDWRHAQPNLSRDLIARVQSASDALRTAGQGTSATTGRLNTPNMQSAAPGGIVLSSASLSIQLLRPLSSQEVLSVALSIFKRLSVVFENLQEWTDFIGHSSFSQEDLPSNLIGFYRAAMNYSRSDIENYCGLITANNPIRRNVSTPRHSGVVIISSSLQEYRRDHDFERNYTFTPVDTVGPWPSRLSSVPTTNADNLYRIQSIQAQRGPHNIHRLCPIYRVVGLIGETDLFILSVGGHRFTATDNLRVKPTYRFKPTTHGAYGHTTLVEVEPYGASDATQFRAHGIPSPIEVPENVLVCLTSHSNPI